MNILEKFFDKLYKEDETIGELVPTRFCIILACSIFIAFAGIVFLPPLLQPNERDAGCTKPLDTVNMESVFKQAEDQKRDFPPKDISEFKENVEKFLKDRYE